MRSTKSKVIKGKGMVYSQGRIRTEEQYQKTTKYKTDFNKKTYRSFTVRIPYANADLVKFLESQNNFTEYARALLQKKHCSKREMTLELVNGK